MSAFFGHESHDINITIQAPFFKIIRKAAKSFFVSFSVYILDIWIGSIFLTWVGSDPGIQDCQEVRLPNTWTHATPRASVLQPRWRLADSCSIFR